MKEKEYVSYELADMGTRLIAAIIDGVIVGVINGVLFGILRDPVVGFLVGLGYFWYFWTRNNGQSPGKSVMKIRVIKKDGTPMKDADAIVRFFGYYISAAVLMIGFLWAIWDENRQGWHDKIASTYVIKAE